MRDASIGTAKIGDAFLNNFAARHGFIQTARIAKGDIFDLTINNIIQSANYNPGTAGWLIRKDGSAEFDAAVIRGTLSAEHIDSDVRNAVVLWTGNSNIGASGVTLSLSQDVTDFATVETLFYLPDGGSPSSYAVSGFPGVLVPTSGIFEAGVAVGRGDGQTVRVNLTRTASGRQLRVTRAFTTHFNAHILALVGFLNPGGITPPPPPPPPPGTSTWHTINSLSR